MADLEHPVLKNVRSSEIIEVLKSPFCIGRALECDYVIQNKIISRKHCTLTKTALGWSLTDLSTNGTLVNSQHLKGETIPLQHNDIVNMGLIYQFHTKPESNANIDSLSGTSTLSSFDENGVSDEFLSNLADNILKEVEKTDTQAINCCTGSNNSNSTAESTNKGSGLMNTIEFEVNKCSPEVQCPDGNIGKKCIEMTKSNVAEPLENSSCSVALVSPKNRNKRVKVTVKTSNTANQNDMKVIKIKLPPEQAKAPDFNAKQDRLTFDKLEPAGQENSTDKTNSGSTTSTTTTVTVTVNNSSTSSGSTSVFDDLLSENNVPAPINEVDVETTLTSYQEAGPSNSSTKNPEKCQRNQNQLDDVEEEMMCSICANLFIKAVTLDCSHSFCEYCIGMWKKKKSECPICRKKITLSIRTLVLDNFIEKFVENSCVEVKEQRRKSLAERALLVEQMAAQSKPNQNSTARRSARNQANGTAQRATPEAPPIITIADSSSSSSGSESDSDYDDDYEDLTILLLSLSRDYEYEYNGRPGAYFGGYGRCFKCGDRGHWANGCPYG
ncbi:E3 ubiquitin-protein ligase RNF8-like isoform X2 [Cylas formicarius]|uniref:E3 ubiquitin-protein ligase RNF8-like isoform X2 n=1 Tax=Cylas formicarius TaxID=197179 RepID=UPI002958BB77|nr:E3 ubiquitin-protein ligase RNF8-like isoform X2 [Cylas formicarius]